MDLTPAVHCPTRADWRAWLQEHHATEAEVWLHYFKKPTGKPSVTYRESVEEALCFGWIDGTKRRVDGERYAHRFTPRRPKSKWSPLNIHLAGQLIAEGKMSEAGLAAFENRVPYEEEFTRQGEQAEPDPPAVFLAALDSNTKARTNFESMAPGYRKQYVRWIAAAKREDTRARRIAATIEALEQNRKPGM